MTPPGAKKRPRRASTTTTRRFERAGVPIRRTEGGRPPELGPEPRQERRPQGADVTAADELLRERDASARHGHDGRDVGLFDRPQESE